MGLSSVAIPRLSIVVPTYNCTRYIKRTIESILMQTYSSYEVIVVDDGSTDDTRIVLQNYQNRIKYVYQENKGVSAARNYGIQLARGEFIAFLDADDLYLPDKLAEQVACFDARPSLGMVHSGWRKVNRLEETIGEIEPWNDAPRLNLKTWLLMRPVFLGAMIFRREWLERVNGFDTDLCQAEDVDLTLRLALMGCKTAWVYQSTVCYRQHEENTMQDGLMQAESINLVLNNFFTRPDVPYRIRRLENRVLYFTQLWIVWHLYNTGCYDNIVYYLRKSLNYPVYPLKLTICDWVGQIVTQLYRDGRDISELHALVPYFKSAVNFDDDFLVEVEKVLNWWEDVWWYYLSHDYKTAAKRLAEYRGFTTQDIIELVQLSLIVSPLPNIVEIVSQFWQDARKKEVVPESSRHEITALFLTVFGKTFLNFHWRGALQAICKAMQFGYHPKAMAAWFRFFQAVLSYLLGFPSKTKT